MDEWKERKEGRICWEKKAIISPLHKRSSLRLVVVSAGGHVSLKCVCLS